MRKALNIIGAIVGSILLFAALLALNFGGEVLSLKWKEYFAPKHAAVERKVFKETRSFNEGKLQDLVKYRMEYLRATDDADKAAIASTIRMSFADYDKSKLPYELEQFLNEVMYK